MEDRELLITLLAECDSRLSRKPNFRPLGIIKEEVEYLLALIDGKTKDRENLKRIQIGLLAIREFEADDPQFADLIFQVADIVKKLQD